MGTIKSNKRRAHIYPVNVTQAQGIPNAEAKSVACGVLSPLKFSSYQPSVNFWTSWQQQTKYSQAPWVLLFWVAPTPLQSLTAAWIVCSRTVYVSAVICNQLCLNCRLIDHLGWPEYRCSTSRTRSRCRRIAETSYQTKEVCWSGQGTRSFKKDSKGKTYHVSMYRKQWSIDTT